MWYAGAGSCFRSSEDLYAAETEPKVELGYVLCTCIEVCF
jgi:hypothetical protein